MDTSTIATLTISVVSVGLFCAIFRAATKQPPEDPRVKRWRERQALPPEERRRGGRR